MAIINHEEEQYYFSTMSGNDAFTVIVRGVAFLDYELEKLLKASVPHPRYLRELRLDYAGKCSLAFALGMDPGLKAPLSAVGNLRNKLAHDPKRNLTAEDATNLWSALSRRERDNIPAFLARLSSQSKGPFDRLSPMDQYVLILVVLRGIIVARRHSIENARSSEGPSAASPDPDTT